MARPRKTGLDYFPVDTSFDNKIQAFDLIYKNDGMAFILFFWQTAYQTETGEVDLSGLFGELLANKCRITVEKLNEMLETAQKLNFLYKTDSGLWTSNGIKKRIQSVSHERQSAILRQERKKEEYIKVKETPHYSANNPLIEELYGFYPSRDENNAQRSTHKAHKDKIKIAKLLSEGIDVKTLMTQYILDCQKTKTYIKDLSAFLNQLPETPPPAKRQKWIPQ
jgi:nitrate/nitrite-specific signal transduction histidine kinase